MCTIEGILKKLVECRNPYSETAQQLIARQCGTVLNKVSDVAKRFSIVIDAAQEMHREIEICRVERDSAKNSRFLDRFTGLKMIDLPTPNEWAKADFASMRDMMSYQESDETVGRNSLRSSK